MLESLLSPETIAVVGASRTPGKVGHEIVANLKQSGFPGRIVPVNPSSPDILGLPCVKSLQDIQGKIDLAVIAVPTAQVKATVEMALQVGVGALVVITAGFKEVGAAGAEAEREIAQLCKSRDVRLLGPNCLGLLNTHHRMNASFAKRMPPEGTISIVSQSGALCTAILDWASEHRMGLAKLISMGNKADLNETDFLKAFADDPKTNVIVCYLESITDGQGFMKVAEQAAARKPVVIFKSGITAAGVRAASSHTGSLAGADIAYGAAFKRSGVIRAETFEAMFDYARALASQPLPRGPRVAVITNAGGPGIMAADAIEQCGLTMGRLSETIAADLARQLPSAASVGNPVDVLGDADAARYAAAVKAVCADDSVDSLIVLLTPQAMTDSAETARAIARETAGGSKPVLVSFMGGTDVLPGRRELTEAGVPNYDSPERAVSALKAMRDYSEWLRRPPRIVTRFPVNRHRVERIIQRHQRSHRLQVGEAEAKDILRAYQFRIPDGDLAGDVNEAVELANRIGYPVAMKIASPDVIHKSDLGGVRLNLTSPAEVRDAFDLMLLRIGQRVPDARINGVYVEKMCAKGREVILGMTRDPQFGPMLMFGLGGIFVEVMKDVTFHIAPITHEESLQMLASTRSYALLKGVRGEARVDIDAIAVAIQRISQLVTDFPDILEMDINPFIAGRVGDESIAADARITLKAKGI
jgi:acetyltransferase